eukprot:s739_g5.t1
MRRCREKRLGVLLVLLAGGPGLLSLLPASTAPELWRYEPPELRRLAIRSQPSLEAQRTGAELQPGEAFEASALEDGGPLTFLQLADGRGFVFAALPDVGPLCLRYAGPTSWIFEPPAHRPLDLRAEPAIDAERTGERLLPGSVFRCCGEWLHDGTLFLELEDGRGWAFSKAPNGEDLCRRHPGADIVTWKPCRGWEAEDSTIPNEMLEAPFADHTDALARTPVQDLFLGQKLKGMVRAFNEEGDLVAIDVGAEVDGFAHISVLHEDFVDDPRELFEVGDEVDAIVAGIEFSGKALPLRQITPLPSKDTTSRLNLSLALSRTRLRPNPPPGNIADEIKVGVSYDGIVSYVRQEGFHVILGDARGGRGHEGFLHISKMPTFVKSAYQVAKVCDKVRTRVLGFHEGDRLELAWEKKPTHRHLQRGQWITGKVYNIQKFGIFVEVETKDGPCQGMVHISEIKEGHVSDINAEAEIGEEVTVRVLLVQKDGRVKFSMLPERSSRF